MTTTPSTWRPRPRPMARTRTGRPARCAGSGTRWRNSWAGRSRCRRPELQDACVAREPLTRGTRASPTAARSELDESRGNSPPTSSTPAGCTPRTRRVPRHHRGRVRARQASGPAGLLPGLGRRVLRVGHAARRRWSLLRSRRRRSRTVAAGSPMPPSPSRPCSHGVAVTRRCRPDSTRGVPRRRWLCATTCGRAEPRRDHARPGTGRGTRAGRRDVGAPGGAAQRHDRVDQAKPGPGLASADGRFAARPAVGACPRTSSRASSTPGRPSSPPRG